MTSINKKISLFLIVIIFTGIFFLTPHPTQAGAWEGLGTGVAKALDYVLKNLFVPIVSYILSLSGTLLGTVLSPNFNSLPFTHGGVVDVGWGITRNIANFLIVAWLIVIAFATIFGAESYGMRRSLPRLILIALLVNFTQVIVGVIVDMAQIVMNFFLTAGTGGGQAVSNIPLALAQKMHIGALFRAEGGFLDQLTEAVGTGASRLAWYSLGVSIFQIIFEGLAAWVFFLLAIMLAFRVVAIWMLVILAPVAFVWGVLPFGQKVLRQWWQQLWNWSFIGVAAAFFVYLAAILAYALNSGEAELTSAFQLPPNLAPAEFQASAFLGTFTPFLIYLTVLIFLFIAYKLSRQTAAMGAEAVVRWGDRALKKATVWAGKKTWAGLGKGVRDIAIRTGAAAGAAKVLAAIPGAKRAATAIGAQMTKAREESEKIRKNLAPLGEAAIRNYLLSPITSPVGRAAAGQLLAERGKLTEKDYHKAIGYARRVGGEAKDRIEAALLHLTYRTPKERFEEARKVKEARFIQKESFTPSYPSIVLGIGAKGFKNLLNRGQPEQIQQAITTFRQIQRLTDQQLNELASRLDISREALDARIKEIQDLLRAPAAQIYGAGPPPAPGP